jgi:hypothetical protein
VDGSDYSLIDNTFNQINATGAIPLAILGNSSIPGFSQVNMSTVPEPATAGLLGIGAFGLLARRRQWAKNNDCMRGHSRIRSN